MRASGVGYIRPMKILISGDMEGVSGITQWEQVTPDHPEYMTRSRGIMASTTRGSTGVVAP